MELRVFGLWEEAGGEKLTTLTQGERETSTQGLFSKTDLDPVEDRLYFASLLSRHEARHKRLSRKDPQNTLARTLTHDCALRSILADKPTRGPPAATR